MHSPLPDCTHRKTEYKATFKPRKVTDVIAKSRERRELAYAQRRLAAATTESKGVDTPEVAWRSVFASATEAQAIEALRSLQNALVHRGSRLTDVEMGKLTMVVCKYGRPEASPVVGLSLLILLWAANVNRVSCAEHRLDVAMWEWAKATQSSISSDVQEALGFLLSERSVEVLRNIEASAAFLSHHLLAAHMAMSDTMSESVVRAAIMAVPSEEIIEGLTLVVATHLNNRANRVKFMRHMDTEQYVRRAIAANPANTVHAIRLVMALLEAEAINNSTLLSLVDVWKTCLHASSETAVAAVELVHVQMAMGVRREDAVLTDQELYACTFPEAHALVTTTIDE